MQDREAEELPGKGSPWRTVTVPGQPSRFASGVLGHGVAWTIAVTTTVGWFGGLLLFLCWKRVVPGVSLTAAMICCLVRASSKRCRRSAPLIHWARVCASALAWGLHHGSEKAEKHLARPSTCHSECALQIRGFSIYGSGTNTVMLG